MNSLTTARFRQAFSKLPQPIQRQAREAYRKFKQNPAHPSLRFNGTLAKIWTQSCANIDRIGFLG